MTIYKVLSPDRQPCHGGSGQWPEPGEWLEVPGPLELCGGATLHLCRGERQLLEWLGPEIWTAEIDGPVAEGNDKIGCLRARLIRRVDSWTDQSARLFACDCVEHTLLREQASGRNLDPKSWTVIEVVRRFITGEATDEELGAAWALAMDILGYAGREAATYAVYIAMRGDVPGWSLAMGAAKFGVMRAGQDAAWSAPRSNLWNAARDAELAWQGERLRAILGT